MEKGKLYFLVGLPRSGKSFFANKWICGTPTEVAISKIFEIGSQNSHDQITNVWIARPRVIIGGDDFRFAIHGRKFQIEAEGHVFACMDTAARALLRRGFDVMIDETSTSEATLRRYLKIDPEATPVFMDATEDECVERAIKDGKRYLIHPISRMAKQLRYLKDNWTTLWPRLKAEAAERRTQDVAA